MSRWVETIQAGGRYTFTQTEAVAATGRSSAAAQGALRRLREQGRIVRPRSGFYVVVQPEYRATGSPPASWFVDDVMAYLDQPYYVGLLSAAAIHGAAHQQPMTFQVVTDRPTRQMRAGKVILQFTMSSSVERVPVRSVQTETGTMRVATAETTAFDLVRFSESAGHLSNVATVLAELTDTMDRESLVQVARHVRLPDVQRLGYLLDVAIGASHLAIPLAQWLRARRPRAVPLRRGRPAAVDVNTRWHVLPNEEVEVDL
jgi:predicted transcriptional regulator of viral defense system